MRGGQRPCPAGWFRCRTNYRCIQESLKCNGADNCRDNSGRGGCGVRGQNVFSGRVEVWLRIVSTTCLLCRGDEWEELEKWGWMMRCFIDVNIPCFFFVWKKNLKFTKLFSKTALWPYWCLPYGPKFSLLHAVKLGKILQNHLLVPPPSPWKFAFPSMENLRPTCLCSWIKKVTITILQLYTWSVEM